MAAIRAKGQPVYANELYGKPIPDHLNAAVFIEPVLKVVSEKAVKANLDKIRRYTGRYNKNKVPLNAGDWVAFEHLTSKYSYLLPQIRKTASKPLCRYKVEWEKTAAASLPHLAKLRNINGLIMAKAICEARQGNMKASADYISLSVSLGNTLRNEPGMISQLVRYTLLHMTANGLKGILQEGHISPDIANDIILSLNRAEISDSYKTALVGERSTCITLIDDTVARRIVIDKADAGPKGAFMRLVPNFIAYLRANENEIISYCTKQIESANKPYREFMPADFIFPASSTSKGMFTSLCSIYPKIVGRRDTVTATLNGSIIAVSLNSYKTQFGQYPPSLATLSKKTGRKLPIDPFSGKSFIYKPKANGYLLYSIAVDLKDSGGIELPKGAKAEKTPHDIVWRMEE